MKRNIFLCLIMLLAMGCYRQPTSTDVLSNEYATGFSISQTDDFTKVQVFDPWHGGQVMATYYLVADSAISTPSDGYRVNIPIRRIATTSCTHVGFLKAIGAENSICGICDPTLVFNNEVLTPADGHQVFDIGDAMQVNVERVLLSDPDAIMVSTFAQGDMASEQLQQLGQTVIFNNEWMEQHPLARAEWIRFVAAFYGELPKADSLFHEIKINYETMREYAALNSPIGEPKPTIMSGNNFRGTWYMPAGNSYMGVLFDHAGFDYKYKDEVSATSLPLTLESVLNNFSTADVWVGSSAHSLAELSDIDEKHTWFSAYKMQHVYNFLKRTTPTGGNDFWEMGVVHPELVLEDLVNIRLGNDTALYFCEHLE